MSTSVRPKERVLAAANHQVTDRVAITFDAESEVYDALADRLGTRGKADLFDRLGVDTWYVGPRTDTPAPHTADSGAASQNIWGYRTKEVRYHGGTYAELCYSPLAGKDSISDIDDYPWPDADQLDFTEAAELAADNDRAVVGTFGWGAYFRATYMRGMENLMLDFGLRPKYAEHLIQTIAERTLTFLDKMLATCGKHIDIVYMADDYCSQAGPLFSPEIFRGVIYPYLHAAVSKAHAYNKKFLLHCCGAVYPLLEVIVDAGVDIVEPIQLSADGMDAATLKREFGQDLCFWGGMDLQQVLCRATPEEVADEARRLIDILGAGGGYIFGPGHTYIQPDAPIENILAMYETAREYRPHRND